MCFAPLGRIDVDPLFEILEILNIEDVYALEIAKFIYKQKNDLLPVSIANYLETRSAPQHNYNLCTQAHVRAPQINCRTQLGEKSIKKRGMELWILIPESIQKSESPIAFKRNYKQWLLMNNVQ